MPAVNSSNIKSVDHSNGALVVVFSSGKGYTYPDVPEGLYTKMLNAESPGKFFAASIKPYYPHKVEKK